jgi:hypothetical protein
MLVKMLLSVMDGQHMARQTPALPVLTMLERYTKAKKRLFFLDYDVCACIVMLSLYSSSCLSGNTCTDSEDAIDGKTL